MSRWSVRRVILLAAAANLLLGIGLFSLRSPVRAAPEVTSTPQLPASVEQLRAAISENRHGEAYSLILSSAELTDMAGYFAASGQDIPFSKIRVSISRERLVIDGVTRGMAVTVPVRVTGVAGATGGMPWARVEDVSLGDTQVPGFLRDQVIRQANSSLDFSRYRMPVTVDSLEMGDGTMAIRGVIR